MGGRLGREVNYDRRIQISLEILNNQLNVVHVGLYQVDDCETMELLSILVDIKVESDVILAEILDLEQ